MGHLLISVGPVLVLVIYGVVCFSKCYVECFASMGTGGGSTGGMASSQPCECIGSETTVALERPFGMHGREPFVRLEGGRGVWGGGVG